MRGSTPRAPEPEAPAGGRPLAARAAERGPTPVRRGWHRFALTLLQRLALGVTAIVALAATPAIGATLIGYDSFVVVGGSMEPAVRQGSLVISERVDPATVSAGDVITYRHPDRPTVPVTHRVVQVFDDQGGRQFQTRGDANTAADPDLVSGEAPISRLVLTIPYAGLILDALRTLPGQIALIAVPALILATLAFGRSPSPTTDAPSTDPGAPSRSVANGERSMLPPPSAFTPRNRGAATAAPARSTPAARSWRARLPRPGLRLPHPRLRSPKLRLPPLPRLRFLQRAAGEPAPALDTGWGTERMQRIARYLEEHGRLADEFTPQVGEGAQPLYDLLARHTMNALRLEENLDRQLQPVREYADALEANVDRLLEQLRGDDAANPALVAQFEHDRARAAEARATIDRMKAPLRAVVERERAAIDALLAGFDPDIEQLEGHLAAQRRDLLRIVSGLGSDQMAEATGFLRGRAAELAGLADAGVVEISEIEAALDVSAIRAQPQARRSPPLARVLEALAAGDATAETQPPGNEPPTQAA